METVGGGSGADRHRSRQWDVRQIDRKQRIEGKGFPWVPSTLLSDEGQRR